MIISLRMDKILGSAVTKGELHGLLDTHDRMVWNSMDSSTNCRAVNLRHSAAADFTDNAADSARFDPWHGAVLSNSLAEKLVEHARMIPDRHPLGYTTEEFDGPQRIDNKATYRTGTPWEFIVRGYVLRGSHILAFAKRFPSHSAGNFCWAFLLGDSEWAAIALLKS